MPGVQGEVHARCQHPTQQALGRQADIIVSAMAAHHVQDAATLMRALFAHLKPGGRLALADLDAEDGSFHPPGMEGVYHAGFERSGFEALAQQAGFVDTDFVTACTLQRNGTGFPIFVFTASKPMN